MWHSYFTGLGTTISLIAAIGAQNLFVLNQGIKHEHPLSAALLCVICDILLISLGVLGLASSLAAHPALLMAARIGGAIFLIGYAAAAIRRALRPQGLVSTGAAEPSRSRRQVLLLTLAITLLNPHVYLDTVLLLGSIGSAQSVPSAFIFGAGCASFLWFMCISLGASKLAPWLSRPRIWQCIDLAVAATMLLIALHLVLAIGEPPTSI